MSKNLEGEFLTPREICEIGEIRTYTFYNRIKKIGGTERKGRLHLLNYCIADALFRPTERQRRKNTKSVKLTKTTKEKPAASMDYGRAMEYIRGTNKKLIPEMLLANLDPEKDEGPIFYSRKALEAEIAKATKFGWYKKRKEKRETDKKYKSTPETVCPVHINF